MLYIFNSGYHASYVENIYKTLFLQNDSINTYRYKFEGTHKRIDSITHQRLNECINDEVMIIYADRFSESDEYIYYPLRIGKLVYYLNELDKVVLYLKMDDFIYTKNIEKFQTFINEVTYSNLPKKDVNNESKEIGYYVVYNKNEFAKSDFILGEDAWKEICSALYSTKVFHYKETDDNNGVEKDTIFTKITIFDGKGRPIKPKYAKYQTEPLFFYDATINKSYDLRLDFFYPTSYFFPHRKLYLKIVDNFNDKCIKDYTVGSNRDSFHSIILFNKNIHLKGLNEIYIKYISQDDASICTNSKNIFFNVNENKRVLTINLIIIVLYSISLGIGLYYQSQNIYLITSFKIIELFCIMLLFMLYGNRKNI